MNTVELELDNYFEFLSKQGSDYLLTPIVLATAYCMDSQKAFENGDIENARSFIGRAKRFAEEASQARIDTIETRHGIAQAAGNASSKKQYGAAKAQVIVLLETKRPVGGWTRSLAIKEISKELESYVAAEGIKLKWVEFPDLLKRWITKDPSIKAAYDANSIETLSKLK